MTPSSTTRTLYANGCSFVAGSELEHELPPGTLKDGDVRAFQTQHAWPQVLAELAGFDTVVNEAMGAGSNARATRMALDFAARYLASGGNPKGLVVCLGLTDLKRSERRDAEAGWQLLKPRLAGPNAPRDRYALKCNRLFYRYLFDEHHAVVTLVQQILLVQAQLARHGISLHLHDAMDINREPIQRWTGQIPQAELIDVGAYRTLERREGRLTFDAAACFESWALARGVPTGPHGHPLADGHRGWAEVLLADLASCGILGATND